MPIRAFTFLQEKQNKNRWLFCKDPQRPEKQNKTRKPSFHNSKAGWNVPRQVSRWAVWQRADKWPRNRAPDTPDRNTPATACVKGGVFPKVCIV